MNTNPRLNDPYVIRACQIFGVKPDQVTPEMRRAAKAESFGMQYGVTEPMRTIFSHQERNP